MPASYVCMADTDEARNNEVTMFKAVELNDPVPKAHDTRLDYAVVNTSNDRVHTIWAYTGQKEMAAMLAKVMNTAHSTNDESIIATSPMIQERCSHASRVVLRDDGKQYIVHYQAFPPEDEGQPYFYNGNYFPYSTEGALKRAWECFVDRASRTVRRAARRGGPTAECGISACSRMAEIARTSD